ncbi:MAG: tRNA 5-methoxyuridine(34)/uridine 5-oxyacetic acid(34) synthase CmoB [Caldithrix sp.]|nr:tRNA 5-methoxyuridine(34)/uridine 5-oxyacetic acid(34) synthase CmoB [Caldithrix sp.]
MDYQAFYELILNTPLQKLQSQLERMVAKKLKSDQHGNLHQWLRAVDQLPMIEPSIVQLYTDVVTIGRSADIDNANQDALIQALKQLHPWRKGPWNLFGLFIDTEWRSDWKWQRLANAIDSLENRLVLDVGCGNGYHCWRMAGAGARLVLGIDPYLLSVVQFHLFQHYIQNPAVQVFPLGIEDMPSNLPLFDTVFSMGVLYHRRSPLHHLQHLRHLLRSGGQLVLETLVVDGNEETVLVPANRYAQMRNVWFIPSMSALEIWLKRCKFRDIQFVDTTPTTVHEQRSTEWMQFESLADHLQPGNSNLTVEGLPAPKRGIITARR